MSRIRRSVATVTVVFVALLWLPLLAAAAYAAEPVITQDTTVNGCNGVLPTPGSENTTKRLDPAFPSDFNPGGVVGYVIDYPVDPAEVGETFRITDCVFVGGTAVAKYFVDFVPNNTEFQLRFSVPIPAGTDLGSQFCNYAKTTGTPSASQASNRKAGPACFTVGGGLRVEKRAGSASGPLLAGASFSVVCAPATAQPPTIVTGLSNPSRTTAAGTVTASGVATDGTIAIVGPSGTPCTVTETAAPAGYVLDPAPRHLTIPVGTAQTVEVFVNRQVGSLSVAKTAVGGGGTFRFAVTCDDGVARPAFDLTVAAGQTVTRLVGDDIRVGTVCTVAETAHPLFTSVRNPASGAVTIDADGATVAFTNTRRTGDLVVHKAADQDGTFTFDVDCTDDAFDRTLTVTTTRGSGTARVEGIPTTVTCTVTERASPLFSSFVDPAGGVVVIAAGDNDVWFTNTRLRGDLVIAKTADEDGTFTFDVDCTDDAYDRSDVTVATANGTGRATVAGIPTGVVCTVTEDADPRWTHTVVPADGTVTIDVGRNPVAFENVRRRGALVITKAADLDGTFTFDVDCTDDAYDAKDVRVATDEGEGSARIDGIPTGVVCTVTEDADPNWTHTVTPGNGTVTIGLGTRTVAFENTRVRGALLVTKATNDDGTFTFDVDCTGTEHDADGLTITTTGGTGSASISGIPTGVSCTVTERADPRYTTTVVPADGRVTIVAGGATVAFTNVRKVGSLVVTKAILDDTASGPYLFRFTVVCGVDFARGFVLGTAPGESLVYRMDGLPTGLECTVAEDAAPGWATTVTPAGGTVTIGDTPVTVAFTNTRLVTGVSLTKASDPPPGTAVTDGDRITYTLHYVNLGNVAADVRISDVVPAGTTLVPGSYGSGVLTERALTWDVTIPPAGKGDVSFAVTVDAGLPDPFVVRNVAFIRHGDDAPLPTEELRHPVAHLSIVKAVDKAVADYGDELTYTMEVANRSAATLTGVVVTDPVPARTTFVSAAAGGACDAPCTTVTWPAFDLAPGATARRTFVVRIDVLSVPPPPRVPRLIITNTAVADAVELAPRRSNEVETKVTAVLPNRPRPKPPLPVTGSPVTHAVALALALLAGGGGLHLVSWRLTDPGSPVRR